MGCSDGLVPLSSVSPSCHAWECSQHTSHRWLQEEVPEPAQPRSQPSYHHGNGPYNDVNIPGCWFFKLPHKASWVLLGLFPATLHPTSPGPAAQPCPLACHCRTPGTPGVLSHGAWVVEMHLCSWGRGMYRPLLLRTGGILSPGSSFAAKGRE